MALHNKRNREELKQLMHRDSTERITLSFYKYFRIADPQEFRDQLYEYWDEIGIMGRVYVAQEGINAQINVPKLHFHTFHEHLYDLPGLENVRLNIAVDAKAKSFFKLTIKVRPKIVADGLEDDTFDASESGEHLTAEKFNELTDREDTLIVDMRNHYESEVGHFEDAICPDVDTFRESLPIVEKMLEDQKDKPVVMYCTGGIRCEKASAYLKHKGFQQVYQLEGGIISYAHEVKEKNLPNKFKGKNFVFDERLGERISDEVISNCHQCGKPCDDHVNCKNETCNLLFIQCKECAEKFEGCCSEDCQEFIHLPEEMRKEKRKGTDSGIRIFSKGRFHRDKQEHIAKS